jgi:hypothetical protein
MFAIHNIRVKIISAPSFSVKSYSFLTKVSGYLRTLVLINETNIKYL